MSEQRQGDKSDDPVKRGLNLLSFHRREGRATASVYEDNQRLPRFVCVCVSVCVCVCGCVCENGTPGE